MLEHTQQIRVNKNDQQSYAAKNFSTVKIFYCF